MRNCIYQSLSDSDKEKVQDNMKKYPYSGGSLYKDLNNNYYVIHITMGTLLDLSSVLKIYNLNNLIDYLFEVTQIENNN